MNKKFTNQVDNIYKSFNMLFGNLTSRVIEVEKLANEIEKVSGYTVEQLLKLFAAGYTLEPPISGYTAMHVIIDEGIGYKHD